MDAGCTINKHGILRYKEYIHLLMNTDKSIVAFQMKDLQENVYTKSLLFDAMQTCDNDKISDQYHATIILCKNNNRSINIINDDGGLLTKSDVRLFVNGDEVQNDAELLHEIPENSEIILKDVSFRYIGSDSNVLENLNLTIPANKITAIVGTSGSGKTTLMKLLLKFLTSIVNFPFDGLG